ncbi:hypothetical protein FM113_00645 [Leucobacter sp. 7(1)]|uniref:hypothetical protein n=1 Tax=Leucobacter sp. 7(1) TaxID=1255613 RepID=UPI00097F43B5|nr:hypothetical protein [Leucobacter sp. 7(1)]SJN08053.1 hypothetical protein FM113_00645 [Leucobacter sp. 7(1)]
MHPDVVPPRSRTARALLAAGTLLALFLLTGCSAMPDTPAAADTGPLAEYLSPLLTSQEASEEAARIEHERAQELTAECMRAEGFDYTPRPFTGGPITGAMIGGVPTSETDAEAEAFARSYGYGIVEDPDFDAAIAAADAAGSELVDINGDYLASLKESEQDAYWETLNGSPLSDEELQAELEDANTTEIKGRGCAGEALDIARSEQAGTMVARDDPEFADLFEAERRLNEPLDPEAPSNEDLVALNEVWTQCMVKVGHSTYTSPTHARNTLGQDFEQMQSDAGELEQIVSQSEQERFQALEIEVASADLECRKSADYDAELTRITHELEQEFVDEYRTELEALLIRYGEPSMD